VALQNYYSIAGRDIEREIVPPVDKEKTYGIIDFMAEIAAQHDVTVARVALAWLLRKPGVTSIIVGAKRNDQLLDNIASTKLSLSDDDMKKLNHVRALAPEYPGWMVERQIQGRFPDAVS
jgi:diketogulonate reductase-like aldo/keto reductase